MGLLGTLFGRERALSPADHVRSTRAAVRGAGGVVTVGDVMSTTGLGEIAAEAALKSMLAVHPAVLEVRDDGTLVYRFDSTSLVRRRLERAWDAVRRFAGGTLLTVTKVSIMLTILGYSLFFVTAAVAAALAAVFASDGDIGDGGDALQLLAMPFRLLAEILFWAPDWLLWGTSVDNPKRRRRRRTRNRGTPVYERVFSFLFGPPSPRLREDQVIRNRAQLIRAHRGVVTVADMVRATGARRSEAEHELATLMGRLGGDAAATERGEVVYLFPELARRAAAEPHRHASAGSTVEVEFEGRRALTGNSAGTNATIAGMAMVTLIGGVAGGALFERVGVLGVLPLMLGSWIPIGVGMVFLTLPPLRALWLQRENRLRAERDSRRGIADMHRNEAPLLPMHEWARLVCEEVLGQKVIDPASAERVLREMGSEFGAEVDGTGGELRYRFPALTAEFEAGEQERRARRLDRRISRKVAFTTAPAAGEETQRGSG